MLDIAVVSLRSAASHAPFLKTYHIRIGFLLQVIQKLLPSEIADASRIPPRNEIYP